MNYPIRTLQQLRPLLVGFRKQAGLSQADVATRLGVTQQSYAKIEANPATTSVERLFTILRLLGGEIVLEQPEVVGKGLEDDAAGTLSPAASVPGRAVSLKKATVAAPTKVVPPSKKTEHW
ncbi:helix-turn-helix domain-containing protein [Duganella sp. FT80W]|jgi:HTH-type transcriptional regulator/antitoxin HipB|uniref:Helix-turn-helix domain-containing protein n=1 Tax=Duganella guangzhouensis TaxID=2666084 RepID=A0A6I2L1G3_9BURK|nr:helix-turn-helix transcriptional regulator [Duganella guangzhouensis]MRW91047.1 helix-turn-helix domain-containing protein [Duganella guangzhouensis]